MNLACLLCLYLFLFLYPMFGDRNVVEKIAPRARDRRSLSVKSESSWLGRGEGTKKGGGAHPIL